MMILIYLTVVKAVQSAWAWLLRTPYVLIGIVLFILVVSLWRNCQPVPRQPTIDIDGIQHQIVNTQREADASLTNRLANIDQRLGNADSKVGNVKTNRNINARELEEKLK